MDFIKDYSKINICDIGSSPCNKTPFIDVLFENTNSKIMSLMLLFLIKKKNMKEHHFISMTQMMILNLII